MKIGIIYKCTNLVNGKIYIGQTIKKLEYRIEKHYYEAFVKHSEFKFQRALRKYPRDKFIWEILCVGEDKLDLFDREKYFIKVFNSNSDSGYNMTDGGETSNNLGRKASEETRKKLRQSHLGYIQTKQHRINQSISRKESHTRGEWVSCLKNKIGKDATASKSVIQYTKNGVKIKEWDCISDAQGSLKMLGSSISNCLHGRSMTAGGYMWKLI